MDTFREICWHILFRLYLVLPLSVGDRYAAHRASVLSCVPSRYLALHFVVLAFHLSSVAFLGLVISLLHFLWLWYITGSGLGVQ